MTAEASRDTTLLASSSRAVYCLYLGTRQQHSLLACVVQVPLMGVLSRVRDALESRRDDDVVAERGLDLLGLLAEADENKVNVASALISEACVSARLSRRIVSFGIWRCCVRAPCMRLLWYRSH